MRPRHFIGLLGAHPPGGPLRRAASMSRANVMREYCAAEEHHEHLPPASGVIVALGWPTTSCAAKKATTTVPVIFSGGAKFR